MYIENKKLKKYLTNWLLGMCLIISIMIIVGGLTRLTDSGLSITQWQLFSGIIPPLNENQWNNYFNLYKEIPEYKLQNFSMTLDEFKIIFWWEFIHRFLGRLIGISFLIPLIYFSFKLDFKITKNFFIIFFLICFQGFIGWYMVSSGLIDRVDVSHYRLSLHLLLAFVILGLLFWNYLFLIKVELPKIKLNFFLPIIFLLLIFLQIIIGAFVSGMDAGMIYNTWPLMGSSYFPDDNSVINFFKLSVFNEPSLVQFIHRNLAYVILFLYLIIFVYIRLKNLRGFINTVNFLGCLLFLQIILGIFTLLSGAQILIASMHQISSIFLVLSTVYLVFINLKTN
jgi:heme a synthase